jgi:hypothetical protein
MQDGAGWLKHPFGGEMAEDLDMPQTEPVAPPDTPREKPAPLPQTPPPQPRREPDPFNPDWPRTRPTPEPKAQVRP